MMKEIALRTIVDFQLLGPLEVLVNGQTVPLPQPRVQCLLVSLLSAGGRVPHERLMDWIWDNDEYKNRQSLYEVTAGLRSWLTRIGLGDALVSKDGWAQLNIEPDWVDVHRFHALASRAQELDDDERGQVLAEAWRLCRDEPLAGLKGHRIDAYRRHLTMECRNVEIQLYQQDLRAGRYRDRLSELDHLFRQNPNDSQVTALYMYALYHSNEPANSDKVYQVHRKFLARQGLKVPESLSILHDRMLRNERDLGPEAAEYLGGAPYNASDPRDEHSASEKPHNQPRPEGRFDGRATHQHANTIIHGGMSSQGQTIFGNGTAHYYAGWSDHSTPEPS